jgi:tetratricopeptide (TPR) repeat protein
MRDDEDALAGYDLTAWEAPPPPASLVDGVIARARESAMPELVAKEERPRVVAAARPRPRWWLAGATAAAVCAVAAIGLWGLERAGTNAVPLPTSGALVATSAQMISLGASSATVDPQAEVHWRREGARLVVAQPRGSVVWQVGAADTLVIDAGATVASVEASGARLRVEVNMLERTNERVIAGSAAVTAAVALVTVLVYEGSAKVSHPDHTVTVVAGERYEVKPAAERRELTVGATPIEIAQTKEELERAKDRLEKLVEERRRLEAELEVTRPATCDEVECVLTNYDGACCAKYKKAASPPPANATPDSLDRHAVQQAVDAVRAQMEDCGANFDGTMKLVVKVAPSGDITSTKVIGPKGEDDPRDVAACMHAAALNMPFPKTKSGGAFNYPFRFKNKPPADPADKAVSTKVAEKVGCDQVDFILEKGNALANHGMWDKALEKFEAALRCKDTEVTRKRAFAAACNAKLAPAASRHYAKLPPAARTQLLPACQRNGVDPTKAGCDVAKLQAKGEDLLQMGMDAEALRQFEEALQCKPVENVKRLAFLAACRAKNAPAAKRLYAEVPNMPSAIGQICVRNGISLDAPARRR